MDDIRIDSLRWTKKQMRKNRIYRILNILFFIVAVITLLSILIPQTYAWYENRQLKQVVQNWMSSDVSSTVSTIPSISDAIGSELAATEHELTESGVLDANVNDNSQLDQLYRDIQVFNAHIFETGQSDLVDAFSYEQPTFQLQDYGIQDDIFGVVSIPKLDVMMPLYLGASWDHMSNGFAQMGQTSIPIGGVNTNCAIACHRGWNYMPYLRDVELLTLGDSVFIHTPWGDLEYRVIDTHIVEPRDTHDLMIQPGRDLVTLITCHPYTVNSHRYIVVCERYVPESIESALSRDEIVSSVDDASNEHIIDAIKGVMVTMRSDGTESSQSMIFWISYFPPLALLCFSIVGVGYILVRTIRFIYRCRSRKKSTS